MREFEQSPTTTWSPAEADERSPQILESPEVGAPSDWAVTRSVAVGKNEAAAADSPPSGSLYIETGEAANSKKSAFRRYFRWLGPPFRGLLFLWRIVGSAAQWCFGLFSIVVGLAFLAAIPVVQFLSLGYLLEVGGRIARTGKISAGFIGVRRAAHVGSIVMGTWIILLPLRYLATFERDARLIDRARRDAESMLAEQAAMRKAS